MSTIKKDYMQIHELIMANSGKKLTKSLVEELTLLCASKVRDKATYYVGDQLVAIYCYYHKQWEVIAEVEYGTKASAKTGLNTMCKVGANLFSKQQRDYKNNSASLLLDVASGVIQASDLTETLADYEAIRVLKVIDDQPEGFSDLESLEAHLAK